MTKLAHTPCHKKYKTDKKRHPPLFPKILKLSNKTSQNLKIKKIIPIKTINKKKKKKNNFLIGLAHLAHRLLETTRPTRLKPQSSKSDGSCIFLLTYGILITYSSKLITDFLLKPNYLHF